MCIWSPLNEEPSTDKKQPISACLWNLSECHWCDDDLNFTLLFLKILFLNFGTTKYVTITGINASALWHYVEFIPVQLKNMQRNVRILQNLRVSVAEYVSRISTIRKAWCCYYSQEFKNTAIRKAKENMLFGQFSVLITGETITVNKAETNEMVMEKRARSETIHEIKHYLGVWAWTGPMVPPSDQ